MFGGNIVNNKMKTGIKILDAMTTNPVTIEIGSSLQDCAKIMAEKHVGGIIITDEGVLTGILTERDIVRKVVAEGKDALNMKVGDIMETKLHKISPAKDVYDAIIKMSELNIKHLPVVDENKFVGLITIKDVLKIQPQLFDFIVSKFELKEETKKPVFGGDSKDGVCELCGRFTTEISSVGGSRVCEDCKKFV